MAHRTAPASTSQQLSTSSFHYCRAPTKSLVQWTHCGHRWRSLSEFLECWMKTWLEKLTHSLKSNHNSKHGKIFTFSLRKALKLSSPIGTWPPPTDWARPTTIIPTFTWPLSESGSLRSSGRNSRRWARLFSRLPSLSKEDAEAAGGELAVRWLGLQMPLQLL